MECPACGSTLRQHETNKNVLFLVCSKWPACMISGTPTLMNRHQFLRDEVARLESRLQESRVHISRLLKKLDEAAKDRKTPEIDLQPMPTSIGDLAGPVAQLRVYHSRLNSATTDEERDRIRAESRTLVKPDITL